MFILTQHYWVTCTSIVTNCLVCGISLYTWRCARARRVENSAWCSGLLCPVSGHCQKSPEFCHAQGFLSPGIKGLNRGQRASLLCPSYPLPGLPNLHLMCSSRRELLHISAGPYNDMVNFLPKRYFLEGQLVSQQDPVGRNLSLLLYCLIFGKIFFLTILCTAQPCWNWLRFFLTSFRLNFR